MFIPGTNFQKPVMIMRFTMLFFFMSIWGAMATSYSQTTKLSLNVKNKAISQVIKEIEEQSEFTFVYNVNEVNLDKKISLKFQNKSILDVLENLFDDNSLGYKITDRHIALYKKNRDQQQGPEKITGTITDDNGDPVIGANVIVEGVSIGTVSDVNGKFELMAPIGSILKVTYIGYLNYTEKTTASKRDYTIRLREDSQSLEEVVVVGYGVQKKSNVTGSVASVKPENFKDLDLGVTEVIQGRVAGVNVSNDKIIIRGAASINGSDPLWIVDGVQGGAPNFNDIESIEILKDAASTSIYGARGAGGVILVTTKKGKAGRISINAKANVGVAMPIDIPDMLSTPDFIDRKLAAGFINNPESGWNNPSDLPKTNWNDEIWRNAFKQNYFLQMTGGNDKTSFNMSADFSKNEGHKISRLSEGGSLRVASSTQINKKVKITEIVSLGYGSDRPSQPLGISYRQVPTMLVYDPKNISGGGWGKQPAGGYFEGTNYVMDELVHHYNNKNYWGKANLILNWEIIKDLTFQANLSGDFSSRANNDFQEAWNIGSLSRGNEYKKDYGSGHSLRMFYTLTYDHTFAGKHYVKGLLGYEASQSESSNAGGWKNGFPVKVAEDMALGTGDKDIVGGKGQGRSLSQFARLNYAYDNKYLFEATIRRDGYDNFGPDNRFGLFPSMSVGWNIAKEAFIADNISWISQLKLRSGWGKIGNNTIGQFLYEPSFTNNLLYYSYDGETVQRGFWYGKVANTSVKWEEVAQFDLGLDIGLLNSRLNITAEYYNKKTSDMLYWIGVPISTGTNAGNGGIPTYPANIGEISNKGFDLMIQYRDNYKDFRYDVAFTLSTNRNKVVKLNDEINPIIWKGPSGDCTWNSSQYRTENGQPMGQLYGYVVEGIFQNQPEIDALNVKASDGIYQQTGTAPGDFRYKDVNKDGKITNEDKEYIGNPWPKLTYGLNISLSWKNFDLMMGWVGNAGFDIFNDAKAYERNFYGDYSTTYKVFDAWTSQHPNSSHPRVIKEDPNGNFKNFSSYFVEDGSYLKLKSLHIGYSLPKSLLSKFYVEGLKVFVNCNNILTFTKFQGDPELSGGYLERTTYSSTRYPASKSVMGGISLTL